ncbi:cytochrome b5-like heme/steroid binding domain-containing protein [Kockovaella imperatae]|uniref:Cytochrome b5-like heme/steroid binding domain-containing protein n=1 Tax=Kockovaella imperatae TaxID=4999 RepID=A0A1Y1UGI3_9TREE|nr:cytochrome b5-like heme/steroid binding domain-containing protein [Kockovaella imperatae]ORX37163.1 cytochrome b5-like heme/steroid binding domain-containing protein [Kockovaella imperatae]
MSWLLPSIPGWSRASPSASLSSNDPDDLDIPPLFPLPNSAQRSSAPGSSSSQHDAGGSRPPAPTFNLAPPSPPKNTEDEEPPSELNIAVLPDATPLGDMAPPPSTTQRPDFGIQPGGIDVSGSASNGDLPKKKKRGKVPLAPGYSQLDWARVTTSGRNLRGTESFPIRVTMDELKKHNTKKDAWSVFNGIVYNITPYLPYHPGGPDELMRVAGRDGTKLFMLTHSWVNIDHMLQECMVGMLVKG